MKTKNLVQGIQLAWHASPRRFLWTAALSMVSALLPPVQLWVGKHLVDLIVIGPQRHLLLADLMPSVVLLGVMFAADRTLSIIRNNLQEIFARNVEARAMQEFVVKAATVDLGHFDKSDWHDRMQRARRDLGWRAVQLSFTVIGLATSVIGALGMLGLLASLHPLLVLLALAPVFPWIAIQRRTNRQIYTFHFQNTAEERERWYLLDVLSRRDLAKEVRAFGTADHFSDRFSALTGDYNDRLGGLYRRANLFASVAGLGTGVALALAYTFIASRGLAGELTAGDLTAAIGAFAAVTSQASMISHSFLSIEQHATFLDDYVAFLAIETLVTTPQDPKQLPSPLRDGIVLENVRFTYPRGTREVLTGLDLEVKPGELVALVGDNGAGKSTIVNLLTRFYDPTAGRVLLGGVDATQTDPRELRSRIGVLFQDFGKYELTLRENVRVGRIARDARDEDIVAALESARAKPLLGTLGAGLDSRLGPLFDGGHELSGGEWQRLALARLMFRSADLWILDEPTSNLDPEAEAAIFAELKQQLAGRMAIVISHRFSTVRVADRIYVIDGGRVLESGTHEQLLAARGRYAELFEIQAAGYR